MDATAPTEVDTEYNVCEFFLKIDSTFPNSLKPKNTVVKYTKLPDFDFDSKGSWSQESYVLQPRLRRIIELDNTKLNTSRSLKPGLTAKSHSSYTKRKVVNITGDEETDLHPRFSQSENKKKTSNRAAGSEEKTPSVRTTSRLSVSSKCSRETKSNAKTKNKIETNLAKLSYVNNIKNRSCAEKDMTQPRKNLENAKGKEVLTKSKIVNTMPSKTTLNKSIISRARQKSPTKSKITVQKEAPLRNKPVTVIHVPIDVKSEREVIPPSVEYLNVTPATTDQCTTVDLIIHTRDANVGTDLTSTENKNTETDNFSIDYCKDVNVQTEKMTEVYDNLDIPNVTLLKERSDISKYDIVNLSSKSLPNLKIPSLKIASLKTEMDLDETEHFENPPYIIGRATVTYTTKQKFDFHVVSGSKENSPESTPSHLVYPVNVLSIFKKEINANNNIEDDNDEQTNGKNHTTNYFNCLNERKTVNCSYVFNSHKLVKPSDLISKIRVNKEYICEQFQRELNFIDSFFESLQYLENCSFSDKTLTTKGKTWLKNAGLDLKDTDYNHFLQKFEHGANDDNETIASKSLCLLNLLIRDEQRRAKNLLFVLKMREDALKDFTKSQILWLENKKKQHNKGISNLKKKQRGALLKLQHECGEMQRMRKTLLSLSEKRKAALMKTKKNIELKLRNSVDVEKILLGKKKLKRNTISDRNIAPLKCFDLSSSGCDESMSSRSKSETSLLTLDAPAALTTVTSAEKCVQTCDALGGASFGDIATETAAENFIVVDGGYLNIIFQNLTLPQIFSSGKQYEVNEEALKNIVNTTNKQNISFGDECVYEKIIDQVKNCDAEMSSSPSTARSLVDELDQYYKSLVDEKSPTDSPECEHEKPPVLEAEDDPVRIEEIELNECENVAEMEVDAATMSTNDLDISVEVEKLPEEILTVKGKQLTAVGSQTTTLSASDIENPEVPIWVTAAQQSSTSTFTVSESGSDGSQITSPQVTSSTTSMAAPSHSEAEELRRQQLAIEREIKALEQQQSQLLVVREIPDKPPPPYTPPTEVKPKTKRLFQLDEATVQKLPTYADPTKPVDPTDAFEVFLKDFVEESVARLKVVQNDKPWDACNILPKKRERDQDKVWNDTKEELKSVLSGVTPSAVSGVSSRRSDHIDDILFEEWRRGEPEWTSLHADEVVVKNQVFEGIFQKILSDTIDEYKKNVLSPDKDLTE